MRIRPLLLPVFSGLLLIFLLFYPQEALQAAREAMELWRDTMLPTLLPFLILTGVLSHTDRIPGLLSPLAPVWRRLFGLSPWGAYVFLLGLLCGYPMGAKLTADLYRADRLDKREAEYLLTFSCNPSPAFLVTYLHGICLNGQVSLDLILGILLCGDFFTMTFFRFLIWHGKTCTDSRNPKKETSSSDSRGAIWDASIMNGFETMARLGGYILLFGILSAALRHFWPFSPVLGQLLLGTAELTTGLWGIAALKIPFHLRFLSSMTLTAFGGFCVMAQAKSVLDGKLSFLPYASAKCIHAAFTAVLVLVVSQIL
ncbi:MAG: hypothetical protein LUG62_02905 [Clostridiales bacterium]|nr:hypothetical protein [Clostridiales bacterium]